MRIRDVLSMHSLVLLAFETRDISFDACMQRGDVGCPAWVHTRRVKGQLFRRQDLVSQQRMHISERP